MLDQLTKLYTLCLAPQPTIEWLNAFSSRMNVMIAAGARAEELVDALALYIAQGYLHHPDQFAENDRAINNLAAYAIQNNILPALFWAIYLAFDVGEIGSGQDGMSSAEIHTRPALRRIVDSLKNQ